MVDLLPNLSGLDFMIMWEAVMNESISQNPTKVGPDIPIDTSNGGLTRADNGAVEVMAPAQDAQQRPSNTRFPYNFE
jgi:hypothetical protein